MLQIDLNYQGKTLASYVTENDAITIGRNPQNDIHIDNMAVSGNHAVVRKLMNAYFIEDRNSTNGTFVNEKKIDKYQLLDGDQVIIGKHSLFFRLVDAPVKQPGVDTTRILDTRKQRDLLDKNR